MLEARDLTARIAPGIAIEALTLDVAGGDMVAVQGDRATRALLLDTLATRIRPTSGSLRIGGVDAGTQLAAVRARIGFGDPSLPGASGLRVAEYLDLVRRARDTRAAGPDLHALLREAALDPDAWVDGLSAADRAAVAVASAILCDGDVLLVDVPAARTRERVRTASGIRAEGASRATAIVDGLERLRQRGAAVVASCDDASPVLVRCTRRLILERGRLTAWAV